MLWLVFPLIASLFYSISGILQNYLVDTSYRKGKGGAYIGTHIFRFALAIILLLVVFGRMVFMLPLGAAIGIMVAGVINAVASSYYYKAYQEGDTVEISIYSKVGPMFSLGLGALLLGQAITASQALAFLFIMAAMLLVVFAGTSKKERAKPNVKVIGITVFATFFSILSDVIFTYFRGDSVANITFFAQSFFFFSLGSLLASLVCLILFESWRKEVKKSLFTGPNHQKNLIMCFADNICIFFAEIMYKLGLIFAPVLALLSVTGDVAKLTVSILLAIIFGRTFPKLIHSKRMTKRLIYSYIIAGVLIAVGVMLVNA